MANDLSFNQMSTVLNAIVAQATGTAALSVVDTSSFVTAGQEALKAGYDTLSTAISQVLSRTIFSIRPYTSKFKGMEMTQQQYGNITRKLSPIDKPFVNDPAIDPSVISRTVDFFCISAFSGISVSFEISASGISVSFEISPFSGICAPFGINAFSGSSVAFEFSALSGLCAPFGISTFSGRSVFSEGEVPYFESLFPDNDPVIPAPSMPKS